MAVVALRVEHDPVDPEAIDVWVDGGVGDSSFRFRLDTGAGRCRIPSTDATRGLPSIGIDKGVAASGIGLGEDEIEIPVLHLADLELTHVEATRAPADADVVPLLGMSALGRFRCHFRFSSGELELADSLPTGTDEWLELSMHATGQPTMPVHFGDLEVVACWDTGAGLTAVDTEFARTHPELFEPIRAAVGIDASGVEMSTRIAGMQGCPIGDVRFPASVCALVDLSALNASLQQRARAEGRDFQPMSFIIGMPLISQADWDFDFPVRRWSLRPLHAG